MIAGRAWIPRLGLALTTVVLTVVLGRVWCGWICPMGTVLEWIRFRRVGDTPNALRSPHWRSIKYVILALIVAAALFGNLTLMILDPISLLTRTTTTAVLPALNYAITSAERALYAVRFLRPVVDLVERLFRGPVLPLSQYYYANAGIALLFLAILGLNAVTERFWCRYLCPLGGLLALLSKIALLRRLVGEDCNRCAQCVGTCPMDTIDPERGYESDPGECTVCLDCLVECPRRGIDFRWHWEPVWREYDPSRREMLASLAASATGVALINTASQVGAREPHLVRPPGALDEAFGEDEFLSRCIRCSACIKVCPTAGLQPSGLAQAGLKGLWTPHLVPRLGQCDYGCHACGQVCPSEAIRPLPLPVKQVTVIGRAYIDVNRCLPWADNIPCAVCEEMCPVPDKAIILLSDDPESEHYSEYVGVRRGDTSAPVPYVLSAHCIGCGLCEKRCPLNGESAIRVYSPNEPPPPMGYV
jgi:polyferredoxin